MSNKTQLQTNNTNLDALIARVNAAKDTAASLPSAGSTEDLEAVISQQETLIAELSAAVDGKASGGGGGANIQTATVTISLEAGSLFMAGATLFEDGVITDYCYNYRTEGQTTSLTIDNVALDSVLVVYYVDYAVYADHIIEGGQLLAAISGACFVKVTNTTCTVTQYDAD